MEDDSSDGSDNIDEMLIRVEERAAARMAAVPIDSVNSSDDEATLPPTEQRRQRGRKKGVPKRLKPSEAQSKSKKRQSEAQSKSKKKPKGQGTAPTEEELQDKAASAGAGAGAVRGQ